jgi:hypothetical protein
MKKYLLPFLIAAGVAASFGFTSDEKPKIALCSSEESETEDAVKLCLENTRQKLSLLTHNDPVVASYYETFADTLNTAYRKERSLTAEEIEELCAGLEFAAEKHKLQTRKNAAKTPYISHPIGVTNHLMVIGEIRNAPILLGALLHDTVEDTQTTFEELEKHFGTQVADYVRELTDNKSLDQETRKRQQVVHATQKSLGAAQIKLADNLYNLNDLLNNAPEDWSQTRIDRYYEWTQSVVDRLPKANDKLLGAVEETINAYWEKDEGS